MPEIRQSHVNAAKLSIELRGQLGLPVDDFLRTLAQMTVKDLTEDFSLKTESDPGREQSFEPNESPQSTASTFVPSVEQEDAEISTSSHDPTPTLHSLHLPPAILKVLHEPLPRDVRSLLVDSSNGINDGDYAFFISSLSAPDPAWRIRSAIALEYWNNTKVSEALIKCLSDHESSVRHQVVVALSGKENANVERALVLASRDENALVRCSAINGMSLWRSPMTSKALVEATTDCNDSCRLAALLALVALPTGQVDGLESALFKAVSDSAPQNRCVAIRGMIKHNLSGDEVEASLKRAITDEDSLVAVAAFDGLALGNSLEKDEFVISLLSVKSSKVQLKAIGLLRDEPGEHIDRALIASLQSSDKNVAREIIRSLGYRSGEVVEETLVSMATKGPKKLRIAAILSMRDHSSETISNALREAENDQLESIRSAAVRVQRQRERIKKGLEPQKTFYVKEGPGNTLFGGSRSANFGGRKKRSGLRSLRNPTPLKKTRRFG